MKWLVLILSVLFFAIVLVLVVAFASPARSEHTRTITLKQTPEAVFAALADVQKMPEWNRNVSKVELLPSTDGKEATKQTFKGGMTMTIVTTESLAPTHLVRAMRNEGGPFIGTWSYEISPTAEGSKIVLREVSEIKSPFFRLMVRLFGATKYMDEHLVDLARHFGEKARPQ